MVCFLLVAVEEKEDDFVFVLVGSGFNQQQTMKERHTHKKNTQHDERHYKKI